MFRNILRCYSASVQASKGFKRTVSTEPSLVKALELKSEQQKNETLTDTFGRKHTYLRISLTERCNLRCQYCMPAEGVTLSSKSKLLTTDEIVTLTKFFVAEGITKVRLTGGEPTLRQDLVDLVGHLTAIPGLNSVSMTTNGIALTRQLVPLLRAGLQGLNISLDSLDTDTYARMTRRNGLAKALAGIDLALQLGVNPLKVNCVVVRNENSHELMRFVDWARDVPIEIRFIEFMPFTGNAWDQKSMISCKEILKIIRQSYPDLVQLPGNKSDTAKLYGAPGFKGRIGIISSMSDHFCGGCNRLRLMADGSLKVCLFGNTEVSLRDALRANISEDDLRATIQAAVQRKKKQHAAVSTVCTPVWSQSHPLSMLHLFSGAKSGHLLVKTYCTLSHLDGSGNFTMVDVGDKEVTSREAEARALVNVGPQLAVMLRDGVALRKGSEALTVARLAGTIAAKRTSDLIPLCHQLQLRFVGVEIQLDCEIGQAVITSKVKVDGKTGCELEALTAVSVAALTLYDMCKAINKGISITNISLTRKSGGKTGDYDGC